MRKFKMGTLPREIADIRDSRIRDADLEPRDRHDDKDLKKQKQDKK